MDSIIPNSFPLFKKAEWRGVFLKEVGSEVNETMRFMIDGLSYDPYYTADEIKRDLGILPKASEIIHLGQVFDFRNGKNPISELKRSLSHDYDAPVLLLDGTTRIEFFEDIQMAYISPRFHLFDVNALEMIKQLEKSYEAKNWHPPIVCMYESHSANIHSAEKIYFEYETTDNVADFIKYLFEQLDKLPTFDPEKLIIRFQFSGQFINDIVKVRAVKIAYFNYLECRDIGIFPFWTEITWDLRKEYPEVLLAHTNNVVAATIAQVDSIVLDLDDDIYVNRILRNSCHIALIESHLSDNADPGAGSYFLEYVALDLAKKLF